MLIMLPKWIGIPYCILYATCKGPFSLGEAREILKKNNPLVRKILSELKARGFLIAQAGGYYLPSFDEFCLGMKLREEYGGLDIEGKLRKAGERGKEYLVVGSYAAFLYHGYQFPAKHEIRVPREQYGFWHNLLEAVSIQPTLTKNQMEEGRDLEGLKILSPERLVVELLEDGGTNLVLDAVSVLVSQEIQWKRLAEVSKAHGLGRELGAVLEILEGELGKAGITLVPQSVLEELSTRTGKAGRLRSYPRESLIGDDTYSETGKRWRLRLSLPPEVISKPVEDIALGMRR